MIYLIPTTMISSILSGIFKLRRNDVLIENIQFDLQTNTHSIQLRANSQIFSTMSTISELNSDFEHNTSQLTVNLALDLRTTQSVLPLVNISEENIYFDDLPPSYSNVIDDSQLPKYEDV